MPLVPSTVNTSVSNVLTMLGLFTIITRAFTQSSFSPWSMLTTNFGGLTLEQAAQVRTVRSSTPVNWKIASRTKWLASQTHNLYRAIINLWLISSSAMMHFRFAPGRWSPSLASFCLSKKKSSTTGCLGKKSGWERLWHPRYPISMSPVNAETATRYCQLHYISLHPPPQLHAPALPYRAESHAGYPTAKWARDPWRLETRHELGWRRQRRWWQQRLQRSKETTPNTDEILKLRSGCCSVAGSYGLERCDCLGNDGDFPNYVVDLLIINMCVYHVNTWNLIIATSIEGIEEICHGISMMTSWHGSAFHITFPLWEKSLVIGGFLSHRLSNVERGWYFLMLTWTNCCTNSWDAVDLRRYDAQVTSLKCWNGLILK